MNIQAKSDGKSVKMCLSVLQFLLKDLHPRDFTIRLWDGSTLDAEPGMASHFTMVIRHPGALRSMFLSGGERALAEAYIYDDFDIEGSMESVFPMVEHLVGLNPRLVDRIRLVARLLSLPSRDGAKSGRRAVKLAGAIHSVERDRLAVTYHYNTSNAFFALYLDGRMVYSCGYFATPEEDLDSAQERKLDYICRKLRLREGERLLDIGCGWGGMIIYAAKKYGVSALGITLSEPQAELANERIRQERLEDRCRAEVRDYRDVDGPESFDKLVSIGMVEHVGRSMLPEYFKHAWRLLRPGGTFLNHGIAEHGDHRRPTFSQGYVFPDSEPVPLGEITTIAEGIGFEVRDVESLREHYMLTLRHWVRRLEAHREEAIRATDESTYRVWRLYMSAAARQFKIGETSVYQSLLMKPAGGDCGLPLTRADWYK
jgi:cyclopropane-fatty-acyl-phospholipid synthase